MVILPKRRARVGRNDGVLAIDCSRALSHGTTIPRPYLSRTFAQLDSSRQRHGKCTVTMR